MAMTLCWNCKKAIGECSWSKSFKPVKGWNAIRYEKEGSTPYVTYTVLDCPEFERDAYDGGARQTPREITLEKK